MRYTTKKAKRGRYAGGSFCYAAKHNKGVKPDNISMRKTLSGRKLIRESHNFLIENMKQEMFQKCTANEYPFFRGRLGIR